MGSRPRTSLKALADRSPVGRESAGPARFSHGTAQYLLCSDDQCVDLTGDDHRPAPYSRPSEPGGSPATGAVGASYIIPAAATGEVPGASEPNSQDPKDSAQVEARNRHDDEEHEREFRAAEKYWKERAAAKDWDCIKADLSVYRYSGKDVKTDPRRTKEYRDRVVEALGFGPGKTREGLTETDMAACREVLSRKAGAFWLEGEDDPRTALRYLLHDTIPTGPPCRTPPHRLKGEEADWVDEQLQKDVISGQLIRGNHEWASPPLAVRAFC